MFKYSLTLLVAFSALAFSNQTSQAAKILLPNNGNNECLDISGGGNNTIKGSVIVWPCHGLPNQQWIVDEKGRIKSWDGQCLNVELGQTTDGAPIIMFDCNDAPNEKWSIANGHIVGPPNMCLDASGGAVDAAHVILFTCASPISDNQNWQVE